MSHIFLIGFMGAGKSTAGRLMADRLGLPFVDLDEEIVASAGRSITGIFDAEGEEGFRTRESAALAAVAAAPASVIACGGGIVLVDENRRLLKEMGVVLYLKVTAGEALARIGDTTGRPLLERGDAASMAAMLLAARETLYCALADAVIDTAGMSPSDVAAAALEAVRPLFDGRAT